MNRRNFMASCAAVAEDPDTAFLGLWHDFLEAHATAEEIAARYDATYSTLPAWVCSGATGWPEWSEAELKAINMDHSGGPRRLSRQEVEVYNQAFLVVMEMVRPDLRAITEEENAARLAALDRKLAEAHRLYEAAGLPAIDQESEKACERIFALEDEIMSRPAHGILGLYVKLSMTHFLAKEHDIGPEGYDPLLADLRRLTRMGALDMPRGSEPEGRAAA